MERSSRRDLLKLAGVASLAGGLARSQTTAAGPMADAPFAPIPMVRVGIIGTGGRGSSLADNFAAVPGARISALCDIVPEKVLKTAAKLEKTVKGFVPLATFHGSDHAFEGLLKRDDVDLVAIATPWNWHVPMAVAAMKQGKHVAVEVPAASTIEECWQLVDVSESTHRHCVMLENCCYGFNEMMVLNMVRAGVFGELIHAGAAYNHDLRSILFGNEGEGLWRRAEHIGRNGNLYPTHGLGPVARYMDINRGDRFDTLVSMSSLSAGLQQYRQNLMPFDPRQKEIYRQGDFNVSLIRTAKGRVIELEHNVSNPQPYDRINLIAGTRGIFRDYPPRVYLDGFKKEAFESLDGFKKQYEPALWKKIGEMAKELGGHGGMDFVMAYRLVECMHGGMAPDIDVYDAAAWSAPGPLSESSAATGGMPQKFPDFTRGGWQSRKAV
jgi:hypothetical protein